MTAKECINDLLKMGYTQYGNLYQKTTLGYIHTFVLTPEKIKYTAVRNWTQTIEVELDNLAFGSIQAIEEYEKHGI